MAGTTNPHRNYPEGRLPELEVEAATLVQWIDEGQDPCLSTSGETRLYSGYKGKLIRMNDVNHLDELPKDRPLIIYCAAGVRSLASPVASRTRL